MYIYVLLIVIASVRASSYVLPDLWSHDPDILHNVSQLISSKGYPVEDHVVETADGYLLSVQRIPHGIKKLDTTKKPAVLLQHGLLSAASDWVLNFPQQSLGFLLSDAGYDVWLGNIRGNTYSNHHVTLKPSMSAFWNYSFDEMAEYDLPAMIDYILNETQETQLVYIGHSQGTTAAFALLSQSPLYNQKIKLFVALAPVSTVGYITNFVKYFAPFTTEILFLAEIFGINDFLPNNAVIKYFSEEVCDSKLRIVCENIMFLAFGYDEHNLNKTRLGVYLSHTPAGSSVKSIAHYGQLVISKKFQKYDYGVHNKEHYNQSTPPEYDISKITTPTALFWANDDNLADVVDVSLLQKKLKSLVKSYCVPDSSFNHGDFILATHARQLVYDEVIALLNQ